MWRWMKWAGLVSLLGAIVWLAVGLNQRGQNSAEGIQALLDGNEWGSGVSSEREELAQGLDKVMNAVEAQETGVEAGENSTEAPAAGEASPEKKLAQIASSLGEGSESYFLAVLAMEQSGHLIDPKFQQAARRTLKKLNEKPTEGISMISSALKALPSEGFSNERAALIEIAARLPAVRQEVRKLAFDEFAIPLPASPAMEDTIGRVAAFRTYIRSTDGPAEALEGVLAGIGLYSSVKVHEMIAEEFLQGYPHHREMLSAALQSKGIQLKLPDQAE